MREDIDSEILRLAIPNMISNISIPLLSTVDVMLMGDIDVANLAAIGIGTVLFNMIYWNLGFLRMGTTGMVAQAYGANDVKGIAAILGRAIIVAALFACMILLIQSVLFSGGEMFFSLEGEQLLLTKQYFNVRIWAAPATLLIYVLFGWLFGMQNAWLPLWGTICINVVNMIVSYVLVSEYNMGMRGVALGTVVAQYFGVVLLSVMIVVKYRKYIGFDWGMIVSDVKAFGLFLSINGDIFVRTVCLTFVFSFFYAVSVELGTVVLAVNVILQQFINWMSYAIDGFAYAAESLVGKYRGAQNGDVLKRMIVRCLGWSAAIAFLFSVAFYCFDTNLVLLFSDDRNAIAASEPLLAYVCIFPLIAVASYIWDGIFVGLLATKSMRNSMVISLGMFLLTLQVLPQYENGEHIWIALCVFVIARGGIQSLLYYRYGTELK